MRFSRTLLSRRMWMRRTHCITAYATLSGRIPRQGRVVGVLGHRLTYRCVFFQNITPPHARPRCPTPEPPRRRLEFVFTDALMEEAAAVVALEHRALTPLVDCRGSARFRGYPHRPVDPRGSTHSAALKYASCGRYSNLRRLSSHALQGGARSRVHSPPTPWNREGLKCHSSVYKRLVCLCDGHYRWIHSAKEPFGSARAVLPGRRPDLRPIDVHGARSGGVSAGCGGIGGSRRDMQSVWTL